MPLDPEVLKACKVDDREIYSAANGDKIFVTSGGGIGFNVGARCIVRPLSEWFALAAPAALFTKSP